MCERNSRSCYPAVRRAGVPSAPTATSTQLDARRLRRTLKRINPLDTLGSIPEPTLLPLAGAHVQRRQTSDGLNNSSGSGGASGLPSLFSSPTGPPDNSGTLAPSSGLSSSATATSQDSSTSSSTSQSSTSQTSQSSTDSTTSSTTTTSTSSTTSSTSDTSTSTTSSSSSSTTSDTSTSTSSLPSSSSDSSTSSTSSTPPSSSSPVAFATSASMTSTSSSASSSGIFTTIFSTIVTDINGQPTTLVTAIPTTLPYPSNSGPSGSSKRAIITGSAIGGSVFLVIIVALVIFIQRSDKIRMNYKKLRVFGRGRRRLIDDEDDDDWLPHAGIATTTQYRDYPASTASSSRAFGLHARGASGSALSALGSNSPTPMQEFHPQPPQPTSPYLMGKRAASSGSIFHEAVWPPPSDANRFVDPLVDASSHVDLARIVPDVMGPRAAAPQHARSPSQAALLAPHTPSPTTPTAPAPVSQVRPSHSLKRSWERAKGQEPDQALYDLNHGLEQDVGSPVMEPPQTRLYIRNAEPLSPGSPPAEPEAGLSSKRASGSPGGSPRWIERQVKKE